MAKTRITEHVRHMIIQNCLNATAYKQRAKLVKKLKVAGDALYKAMFGKHVRLLDAAPGGFFSENDLIHTGSLFGLERLISLTKPRRVPAMGVDRHLRPLGANHPAVVAYVQATNVVRDADTAARELEEQLAANIRACRTLEKLIEMWPEGKKYIPMTAWQERQLPVVQFGTVNGMIAQAQGRPVDPSGAIAL